MILNDKFYFFLNLIKWRIQFKNNYRIDKIYNYFSNSDERFDHTRLEPIQYT